jgi:diacylglycerol kinase family enzyme
MEPVRIDASLDGEDVSGEYLLFEALNIPFVGPNLYLAPDSRRGDGQLDLVMATAAERERLAHYLEHWEQKKPRLAVLPTRQGKHLQMRSTGHRVHIDDEFWPQDAAQEQRPGTIDVRMEDVAVDFLAPAELQTPGKKR